MANWVATQSGSWSNGAANADSPWYGGNNPADGSPGFGDTVDLSGHQLDSGPGGFGYNSAVLTVSNGAFYLGSTYITLGTSTAYISASVTLGVDIISFSSNGGSLTLGAGSVLSFSSGGSLSVSGNVTINGTLNSAYTGGATYLSGDVTINGTLAVGLTGNSTTVQGTVLVDTDSNLNISGYGSFDVSCELYLTNAANLWVNSGAYFSLSGIFTSDVTGSTTFYDKTSIAIQYGGAMNVHSSYVNLQSPSACSLQVYGGGTLNVTYYWSLNGGDCSASVYGTLNVGGCGYFYGGVSVSSGATLSVVGASNLQKAISVTCGNISLDSNSGAVSGYGHISVAGDPGLSVSLPNPANVRTTDPYAAGTYVPTGSGAPHIGSNLIKGVL